MDVRVRWLNMSRIYGNGAWLVECSYISLLSHEGRRGKKGKESFGKLVIDKGRRGSHLSDDQPRTQRLFMILLHF